MVNGERISPTDTTWLRMERPTNPMVITGVLVLEGPIDYERLAATIASRLLNFARLRQRVEEGLTGFWWVSDDNLSVSRHIKRTRLPGRAGHAELECFVADLASQSFDPAHPLWQCHVVEDYDGGAAVVARVHHAVADGLALIALMLSLTDPVPEVATQDRTDVPCAIDVGVNTQGQGFLTPLTSLVGEGLGILDKVGREVLARGTDPQKALKDSLNIAGELAYLLLMPEDSPSIFRGKPRGEKRVAWTDPLELAEIKAISRALGCRVNDMLLCAVAGALRSYLLGKGEQTDGVELRTFVPVNLRTEEESGDLGNIFGIVAVELPVGVENPLSRLYELHRRMEALKQSYEPAVTLGLIMALGYAPHQLQDQIFHFLSSKATAVMTNVPGPQHPRYLAGSRVKQVMFWVPQSYDIAMGISILSFDGKVQFGIMTDAAIVLDPGEIIDKIGPEFEQLLYFVLMAPWGESNDLETDLFTREGREP